MPAERQARRAAARQTPRTRSLWPRRVLRVSLRRLGLPRGLHGALANAGVRTFGDLFAADPGDLAATSGVGVAGIRALRGRLAQALGLNTGPAGASAPWDGGLQRLLGRLDEPTRRHVEGALLRSVAAEPGQSRALRPDALAAMRRHLLARGGRTLRDLLEAARRELAAHGGVVRMPLLAADSPLRALARAAGDPLAPLRLLAFAVPDELSLVADALLGMPAALHPRIAAELDRALAALSPPIPVADLGAALAAAGLPPLPWGILEHLLRCRSRLQLRIDPARGELLSRRRPATADRLELILREAGGELPICDLLFRYRDRCGAARKLRLLDGLHGDCRFLQVADGVWDLRDRHLDALELARPAARRIRERIRARGSRHQLEALLESAGATPRLGFLVRDLLRRDPALRSLGRGAFCPRRLRESTQLAALCQELRRATGEVPLQRFLANQPATHRRLRQRLLLENRRFVLTAPDRVDLLGNYPLSSERLAELLRVVVAHLAATGGYDRTERLLRAVQELGIEGSYLTPWLLRDLLRRHGRFELLAGDLVAMPERGMKGWIQQRARDAIRTAARALTPGEILSASPELAEFADCLEALLGEDPLVQSPDGERYLVV